MSEDGPKHEETADVPSTTLDAAGLAALERLAPQSPPAPPITSADIPRIAFTPKDLCAALCEFMEALGYREISHVNVKQQPLYDANGLRGSGGQPLTIIARAGLIGLTWVPTRLAEWPEGVRKARAKLKRLGIDFEGEKDT